MRFHSPNGQVVLRSCAPERDIVHPCLFR